MLEAQDWIKKLRLEPHPEGGYFRQAYKADLRIQPEARNSHSPQNSHGAAQGATRAGQPEGGMVRAASTAIYFLLEGQNFSGLHRLRSDEVWHFYAGSPLVVEVIEPEGRHVSIRLGSDWDAGQMPQAVVRAGCWFGSHVADWKSWALVGCTVAPGFEFEDFEMGKRAELIANYPQHRGLIERLTRG